MNTPLPKTNRIKNDGIASISVIPMFIILHGRIGQRFIPIDPKRKEFKRKSSIASKRQSSRMRIHILVERDAVIPGSGFVDGRQGILDDAFDKVQYGGVEIDREDAAATLLGGH
jgi:hypothetical protein